MVDVAIVGIGCRFAGGVNSPSELWQFLLNKGDGMVEVPAERWNLDRFYDPDPDVPGKMYVRRGGFLTDSLEAFDPEFFGISPREASIMDPQQRLLLEVAQEALDDAGHAGRVAGRPVGVYVGGFTADNMAARHAQSTRHAISMHTPTSSTYTMLSNRLSFAFDLRGPSMTIDTACSSSLVALHEAVSALQRAEIEMALVGGVNAMIRPETFISMCKGHFLAPDGRCKTFDKRADGYARGEGAGIVVLRPLAQAQADGDRIYAVIKATGANQDGRTPGITVPNPEAQAALIQEVTQRSGLDPAQIGYVEAHGTGTAVGDPLEMAAIGKELGAVAGRHSPLRVGSIKPSIGHTEAAAGVASVIKTALTLYHRTIVPQGWLDELNPAIPFSEYQVAVPLQVEPFPPQYELPAAAINGFGYGGTNAHAILVAPPAALTDAPAPRARTELARIFPICGRNEVGVRSFAKAVLSQVASQPSLTEVDALVDQLWTRRAHQPTRFAVPYASTEDLLARLRELADGKGKSSQRILPAGRQVVFVLSGMGPQWWGMARELIERPGTFSRVAHQIDEQFTAISGWSILAELRQDEAHSKVHTTQVAQTGNFLVQVALAAELAELGIHPAAIVGHSVGEVSAAYLSGMLSLREALTVSYHRARLQAVQAGTGSMLAVGLAEQHVLTRLRQTRGIEIAAVNSPAGVTLAGDTHALLDLAEELTQEGIFNRMLKVEVPYHSHLMDPILAELRTVLRDLQPKSPTLALYSTVTGAKVTGNGHDGWGADYWLQNVRQSVRFADAIGALISDGFSAFLEVGPHPVLSGNVREILAARGETGRSVATLYRNQPDSESLRTLLAELYNVGALDDQLPPGGLLGAVRHQDLPRHLFQRITLWSEESSARRDRLGDAGTKVLPGHRTEARQPEWECDVSVGMLPWLPDHVVADAVLLPGAAYLDAALAAAVNVTGREQPILEDIEFIAPLMVGQHEAPILRCSVDEATGRFQMQSRNADETEWTLRAKGRIVNANATCNPAIAEQIAVLKGELTTQVQGRDLYDQLARAGLRYGPSFQQIQQARVGEHAVLATLNGRIAGDRHQAHPAVVDCALQCMATLAAGSHADGPVVPAAVQSVRQFGPLPEQLQVLVTRQQPRIGEADLVADIVLADEQGRSVLELTRVQFRPISPRPPLVSELNPLWYELISHPLAEVTTLAEEQERTPPSDFLVVGVGEESRQWGEALSAATPHSRMLLVDSNDPGEIADAVGATFHAMLAETSGPVTVVLCTAAGQHAAPSRHDLASLSLTSTTTAPLALVGTAIAIQEVLTEREEQQQSLPVVRAVVLTQGALASGQAQLCDLQASAVVGARRVLRNEYSSLRWRLLDIEPQSERQQVIALLATLDRMTPDADEIALRGGIAYGQRLEATLSARLQALDSPLPLTHHEQHCAKNYAIELPTSHLLRDLALREVPRQAPAAGEIELQLQGLELNYKDAMKAIGLLSEKALSGTYFGMTIGMSGVGVVTRVGPDVTDVTVGDTLVFGTRDMAKRYVTARLDNGFFIKVDPAANPVDFAAMVPLLTAQYSVFHAANVQPGEVVLVHGGAGGVGMATIQAANAAGAMVIATASSPERRDLARNIGAHHVLDSRSLNFVEEIYALTHGHGADVIITAAPGEIMAANLKAAAEFGRVVEVGKLDIFTARSLDLSPFEKNLAFISVDIDRMTAFRPQRVRQLQQEIFAMVAQGNYPPLPGHLIPLSQMADGFEMVQRSTHIGRVMLDFNDPNVQIKPATPQVKIDPEATYLISGGFGAFGLATARWLAGLGARTLLLLSRSGASTPEQQAAVSQLQASGVNVISERLNIADQAAVTALLADIRHRLPPVRGVFHTAGVVQDGPFSVLTRLAMENVMAPKAMGAINLHRALADTGTDVDYFVLYSSISSVAGIVPQTSYAAANSALDQLAAYRRRQGLPALSINWGALAGGGMAEASEEVIRYLAMMGLHSIDMDRACDYMAMAMAHEVTQAVICHIDWETWSRAYGASGTTLRFADIVQTASSGSSAGNEVLLGLLALAPEERVDALAAILIGHITSVMGIAAEAIDLQTPLSDLGMDSLMAVELNLRITTAIGVELSVLEFTRGGGVAALAARLLPRMIEAAAAKAATA